MAPDLDQAAEDLALLLLNRPEDAAGVAFTHKWYDHNKDEDSVYKGTVVKLKKKSVH